MNSASSSVSVPPKLTATTITLSKVIFPNGEQKKITITIETCYHTKNMANKLFLLKLFDETDPFLFFECCWDEDSFLAFKNQQNLLVDFQGFGSKFHELLSHCRDDKERFQASLWIKDNVTATLTIEENTRFRTLDYLSVDLKVANQETIQSHFKQLLNRLYGNIENLQSQVASLETQLTQEKAKNEQITCQLRQLEVDTERKIEEWNREKEQQLNKIREENKTEREKWMEELQAKNREDAKKYEEETLNWKQKVEHLSAQESHLRELLEQTQRELTQVRSEKDELDTRRQQWTNEIETLKQEKERYLVELEQKKKRLEELEKKNRTMSDQLAEWEKDKKEKENLMSQVEFYRNSRYRLEEKLKHSIAEINKGNDVIQKLQEELKNTRQKAKMKSTIASQQEQLLQEKQHKIEQLMQEVQVLNQKLSSKERELEHLNQSLQTSNAKLEENQKVLESNQQLINWLNKELNEMQLSSHIISKPWKSSFPLATEKRDHSASSTIEKSAKNDYGLK